MPALLLNNDDAIKSNASLYYILPDSKSSAMDNTSDSRY